MASTLTEQLARIESEAGKFVSQEAGGGGRREEEEEEVLTNTFEVAVLQLRDLCVLEVRRLGTFREESESWILSQPSS